MKYPRTLVATFGLGLGLVLTGCGGGDTAAPAASSGSATSAAPAPTSAAASGSSDAVAWADKFCGSMKPLVALDKVQPPDIKPGDIAGAHKALLDIFNEFVPPLNNAVDGLKSLGDSTIQGADKARDAMLNALTPVRDEAKAAQQKLEKAKASDAQAILDAGQAFQKIGSDMTSFNPEKEMGSTPELNAAALEAPNCKSLGS